MPALLTSTSTPSNSEAVRSASSSTALESAMSTSTAMDRPPPARTRAAVSSRPSGSSPAATTDAPHRPRARAVARPRPEDAPLTTAVLPRRSIPPRCAPIEAPPYCAKTVATLGGRVLRPRRGCSHRLLPRIEVGSDPHERRWLLWWWPVTESGPSTAPRVTVVRSSPRLGDTESNLRRALDHIEALAGETDLVVFPELFSTG